MAFWNRKKNDINKGVSNQINDKFMGDKNQVTPIKFSYNIQGGPGQPFHDVQKDLDQLWSYSAMYNTTITPRASEKEAFEDLRFLANSNAIIRYCIEERKRQLTQLKFAVRYVDKAKPNDERCKKVEKLLNKPCGLYPNFRSFLGAWLEDMFSIDAVAIKPVFDIDQNVKGIELFDASNISLKIDERGQIPSPPQVAYQYVAKGMQNIKSYNTEQLLYSRFTARTSSPYGYSQVEQLVDTIETLLLRNNYLKTFFSDGTLPESIITAPEDWRPAQVAQFQEYWNNLYLGSRNIAKKHRTKFLAHGMQVLQTKQFDLKQEYDEWLARVICAVFGIPPTPFVKETSKATASTMQEVSIGAGNGTIVNHLELTLTDFIQNYIGYDDLEFTFIKPDSVDELKKAQISQLNTGGKPIWTVNESRAKYGMGPIEGGDVIDFSETSSKNGENRLIGQSDAQEQSAENQAELPNQNELR